MISKDMQERSFTLDVCERLTATKRWSCVPAWATNFKEKKICVSELCRYGVQQWQGCSWACLEWKQATACAIPRHPWNLHTCVLEPRMFVLCHVKSLLWSLILLITGILFSFSLCSYVPKLLDPPYIHAEELVQGGFVFAEKVGF